MVEDLRFRYLAFRGLLVVQHACCWLFKAGLLVLVVLLVERRRLVFKAVFLFCLLLLVEEASPATCKILVLYNTSMTRPPGSLSQLVLGSIMACIFFIWLADPGGIFAGPPRTSTTSTTTSFEGGIDFDVYGKSLPTSQRKVRLNLVMAAGQPEMS